MAGVAPQYVPEPRDLGICGLNVQSLLAGRRNKMEEVKDLIYRHKIDIFVLGESWLPGGSRTRGELREKLHIDDFTYERADRRIGDIGGGLIVYLRQNVSYAVKSKWDGPHNVQFLTISITKPTKFDLVAIYSPHSSYAERVTTKMRHILEVNQCQGTPVMFIGDLNIDPGRPGDARAGNELNNLKREFSIRRLILAHTRKQYCIDHIITNIPEKGMVPIRTNVIPTSETHTGDRYVSDHNLILCRVKNNGAAASDGQHPEASSSNNNICHICDKTFKNKQGLSTHQSKIHTNEYKTKAEQNSALWCPICSYKTKLEQELDAHIDKHHCVCADCGQICCDKRELATHKDTAHKQEFNQVILKGEAEGNKNVRQRKDARHTCPKCPSTSFHSFKKLNEHVDVNHKRCTICSELCLNERGLSIHIGRVHERSSTQITRADQFTSDVLRRNEAHCTPGLTQISTTSSSTCPICGQVCKNEAGVSIHMGRVHGDSEGRRQDVSRSSLGDFDLSPLESFTDYHTSSYDTQIKEIAGPSCPSCGQVCKNKTKLNIHIAKMHKGGDSHQDVQSPMFHVPRLDQLLSSYSDCDCTIQSTYRTSSSLSAGGSSGSSCPICGKVCKNEAGVKVHMGKMHK